MNHPDIDKAERYGMPEGKPVECAECYRPIFDEDYQCKSCRALVCETCKVRILDNDYCSLECADEDIRHVREMALPVLRHRVITTFNAEAAGIKADQVVERLLAEVQPKVEEPVAVGR